MEREINGKMVETDPEGYLVNLDDWSEELAVVLAKDDNLELGENHWKIITTCVTSSPRTERHPTCASCKKA